MKPRPASIRVEAATSDGNRAADIAMAVLGAHVRALRDIDRRNGGEPVDTPGQRYCPRPMTQVGSILPATEARRKREANGSWSRSLGSPADLPAEQATVTPVLVHQGHVSQAREGLRPIASDRFDKGRPAAGARVGAYPLFAF